jgi:hypothetical protein
MWKFDVQKSKSQFSKRNPFGVAKGKLKLLYKLINCLEVKLLFCAAGNFSRRYTLKIFGEKLGILIKN